LEGILLFIHIVVSVLLIIVVLLQSGKSADLAGAFGGYGSQSTFGPRGATTFLSKLTTTLAIMFMITSLLLWIVHARKTTNTSVLDKSDVKQGETVKKEDKKTENKAATEKNDKQDNKTGVEENKKEDKKPLQEKKDNNKTDKKDTKSSENRENNKGK